MMTGAVGKGRLMRRDENVLIKKRAAITRMWRAGRADDYRRSLRVVVRAACAPRISPMPLANASTTTSSE